MQVLKGQALLLRLWLDGAGRARRRQYLVQRLNLEGLHSRTR